MNSIPRFCCTAGAAAGLFFGNAHAGAPIEGAAVDRLELLGFPLGPDAFARAVSTRHRPLIDLCFSAKLDITAPDEKGRTALLIAALNGDWEIAKRLLETGATAEGADASGVTPLMAAALHGDVEMLRAFIARKASPDAADANGRAALHYALAASKLEAVEFLLPLTTDLGATCADGSNALGLAYETNDPKILRVIMDRLPSGLEWNTATRKALAAVLGKGDKDGIRVLLTKHAAPPTPEGYSVPMLAYAISMDETPLFNLLLECGADPDTVIPSPCEKEFLDTVSARFIRHYLTGDSGVTVLMLAASLGREEIVQALLDAGASRRKATPKHRMIALYFATRSDSWRSCQMLLGSGPAPETLRVEISLNDQQAIVFKNGVPTFKTSVSTGRKGFATPPGRYVITDKNRDHRSSIYKVPMPYFMRLSCRDFGLHQGNVGGGPASHGCIRLPSGSARKLFSEIPVGTLVSIN